MGLVVSTFSKNEQRAKFNALEQARTTIIIFMKMDYILEKKEKEKLYNPNHLAYSIVQYSLYSCSSVQ